VAEAVQGEELPGWWSLIEELTVRGFKLFRDGQTIKFTPGLNRISGRNASGKTSILEAILFALYGEVPGVDKRQLVSLGGRDMTVSLVFRSPTTGRRVRIVRSGVLSRGSFRTTRVVMEVEGDRHVVTSDSEVRERLRELIGIGRRAFLGIVYCRQKEFVDILRPDRVFMDSILGLSAIAEVREELRTVVRKLEEEGRLSEERVLRESLEEEEKRRVEVEERLRGIEEELRRLEEEAEGLSRRKDELDSEVRALSEALSRLRESSASLREMEAKVAGMEAELERLREEAGEDLEERLRTLSERVETLRDAEERFRLLLDEELEPERRRLLEERGKLRHIVEEHTKLSESGLTVCPTCGQRIDRELLERRISEYRGKLVEVEESLRAVEAEIRSVRRRMESTRGMMEELMDEYRRLESTATRIKEVSERIEELRAERDEALRRFEETLSETLQEAVRLLRVEPLTAENLESALESRLREVQAERERVVGKLSEVRGRLQSLRRVAEISREELEKVSRRVSEIEERLRVIEEYKAKISVARRLVKRFEEYEREVRHSLLKRIEWLTFKYFQRMTDQQVYHSFRIDEGNYRLYVYPKGSTTEIPAWRCGGGHESIIALAERLAILKAIGFSALLILDEPTDAVDEENIPALLESISRCTREIRQIILVTHHGYGQEAQVNHIRVRRVGDRSVIQQ